MAPSPVRIGLVFGGASGEHAVSIRSANTVIAALEQGQNRERFSVAAFYIDRQGRWWAEEVARAVLASGQPAESEDLPQPLPSPGLLNLPAGADAVEVWYPVLHGPNGEDGTVQGLFTLMGKPFVGAGVLGSAVAMDKLAMKAAFAAAGLAQVPYVGLNAAAIAASCSAVSTKRRPLTPASWWSRASMHGSWSVRCWASANSRRLSLARFVLTLIGTTTPPNTAMV